jgi:glycosyltransferase involved in cell wall biosynthesis
MKCVPWAVRCSVAWLNGENMSLDASIIIPTYNRCDTLLRCLAALDVQTVDRARFEVIVVDDGSTDGTESRLQSRIAHQTLRYFRQDNSGPARARNLGLRVATGDVVVFIGDDILPTPHWLEMHLAQHAREHDERLAVLGLVEWGEDICPTPLMETPGLGANFEYDLIDTGKADPANLPYSFFYTSNVSVRRQFLLENGLFFDEDFCYAMGEDGELAYRMQLAGMRLVYVASALAYHEHRLSFDQICRRRRIMGQVDILQVQKHPEWGDLRYLNLNWRGQAGRAARNLAARLMMPGLRLADTRRWRIRQAGWLHRAYAFVLDVHHLEGLLLGLKLYGMRSRPDQ